MANIEEVLNIISNDDEMKAYLLSKIILTGDQVKKGESDVEVIGFPNIYVGRLANRGCRPGLYIDKEQLKVKTNNGEIKICSILEVELDKIFVERVKELPDDWYILNLEDNFIEDLPKTFVMEGDVVKLVDEFHEYYSKNTGDNQFTIYRIDFDSVKNKYLDTIYRLRQGSTIFYASEK